MSKLSISSKFVANLHAYALKIKAVHEKNGYVFNKCQTMQNTI